MRENTIETTKKKKNTKQAKGKKDIYLLDLPTLSPINTALNVAYFTRKT